MHASHNPRPVARHPPVGEVKGQCRGKKAGQNDKDSQVTVLPYEVEELVRIRQGSTILPLLEQLTLGTIDVTFSSNPHQL